MLYALKPKLIKLTVICILFIKCTPSNKKNETMKMQPKEAFIEITKDSTKTTLELLNHFLPNLEKEQNPFYFGDTLFDENKSRQLLITQLIKPSKIIAIELRAKDSIINFYRLNNKKWKCIGTEKTNIPVYTINFEDLDGDNNDEIITATSRNMNGNTWMEVYYKTPDKELIHYAGTFSTDYKILKKKKQIEENYEGSQYMDPSKTIYQWINESLIPIKQISIIHKENGISYLEYSENKLKNKQGLKIVSSEIYTNSTKQSKIWDTFFKSAH